MNTNTPPPPVAPPIPGGYCPADEGLIWRKVNGTSIPNLWVVSLEGKDMGMVDKPRDTGGDRNYWRAYHGTGHSVRFLGHRSTRSGAMSLVEKSIET